MATLIIRNVDPAFKERLRIRAARNGRSVAAELRIMLIAALGDEKEHDVDLAEAIRRRFLPFGGVELEPHPPVLIGTP
jgi:plasmid stability protein